MVLVKEDLIQVSSVIRVECLTMILAKHDRKKSIAELKKELCMLYPSRKCVFKKYIQVCKWNDYKKNVVHEALKEKQPNKNYRTVTMNAVCICDYCGFILFKNVWVNMVCVHVW